MFGAGMDHTSEETTGKTYDIRIMKQLIGYLKPYRLFVVGAVLLSLLHSGAQLLLPYITRTAIDKYILLSDMEGLSGIAIFYFLCLTAGALFSFGVLYLMQVVGQFVIRDIRQQTFSHLQQLKISFFDRSPVGKLVTRVTNDGEALNHFFTEVVVSVFTDVSILIGVVIVMLRLDIKLSLVTFIIIPPLALAMNLFRIRARKTYRGIRKWLAQLNVHLNETFIGVKVIKIFGQEHANYMKFDRVNDNYYKAGMQQVVIRGVFMPVMSLLLSIGTALIIWWGGGEIVRGRMSLGTLVAFLSYIRMFFHPIQDISMRFDVLQSSLAACERVFGLIHNPEIELQTSTAPPKELKGEIEFKNVWFSYAEPADSSQWVLKDMSFKMNPGQSFAIVGPTGAGKTSIISLLARFYEPQKGEILLDGEKLQDLDYSLIRSNLIVVAQESFIFSGTVSDNIRMRNPRISDEEIRKAAEFVNAHRFIERLPKGYDQELEERGTNLSSGELQLLAFARAIAYSPRILVLDEATREVDPETEELIQDATSRLLQSRTSLVIAHRLSTIKNVDRIIVVGDGRIREQGTHDELLAKKGMYASLYELQYKQV
jgi:ATP-binding cassette subfamily B protein